MNCNDIRKLMQAQIEGLLPSDQRALVEGHLRSCEQCRLYASELKRTIETLRGLDEIEPPADLTAKVMRKIRADAPPQKSWIERLFFPLHIKLPVEAMATLLLTVAAILVYKNMTPELRQMDVQVQPQAPATKTMPAEPEKEIEMKETSQPKQQYEEPRQKEEARPADSAFKMETHDNAYIKEEKPVGQSAPAVAPTMPAPSSSFAPSPALAPAARQAETGKASGMAVREEAVREAAPAAARAKLAAKKAADELAAFTIMVKAPDTARNEVDAYLARNGGELKVLEQTESRIIMTVKLDPAKTGKFLALLRSLGRIKEDKKDLAAESGFFRLVIEKE